MIDVIEDLVHAVVQQFEESIDVGDLLRGAGARMVLNNPPINGTLTRFLRV